MAAITTLRITTDWERAMLCPRVLEYPAFAKAWMLEHGGKLIRVYLDRDANDKEIPPPSCGAFRWFVFEEDIALIRPDLVGTQARICAHMVDGD
jgi:hypothetical protein